MSELVERVAGRPGPWRESRFPPDLWRALAEAGLLGLAISRRWGGQPVEPGERLRAR